MDLKQKIIDETSEISQEIESYVQNRINLTKLQIAEDISKFFSSIATVMILSYLAFFAILMLAIAAGYFLSSLLGSYQMGFFIVAGFFIFLALIFFLLRKQIVHKPVIKSVINLFFPKLDEYDKE